MRFDAAELAQAGRKYLGTPYETMDCQAFVEACLKDIGLPVDKAGSNTWYRNMTWTGTPEECIKIFGSIPIGAFTYILEYNGKEPAKYRSDGIGNASHIGIKTGTGKGALHSSKSTSGVAESTFRDKTIKNGGWNRVGLWNLLSYGDKIDKILEGYDMLVIKDPVKKVVYQSPEAKAGSGTVNVRTGPSTANGISFTVPFNTVVDAYESDGDFTRIKCGNGSGYIMTTFLRDPDNEPGNAVGIIEKIKGLLGDLEKIVKG